MQHLTFKAYATAFVTSGYPDAIDYRRPTGYGAHLDVETVEEAKAIAARFPKSRKVRGTSCGGLRDGKYTTWGYVVLKTQLSPDGTTGTANETGIKRWFAFKKDCERLGIGIEWDGTCFRNDYPTLKSFEQALADWERDERLMALMCARIAVAGSRGLTEDDLAIYHTQSSRNLIGELLHRGTIKFAPDPDYPDLNAHRGELPIIILSDNDDQRVQLNN